MASRKKFSGKDMVFSFFAASFGKKSNLRMTLRQILTGLVRRVYLGEYKKENRKEMNNYKPLSQLSVAGLERVIAIQN